MFVSRVVVGAVEFGRSPGHSAVELEHAAAVVANIGVVVGVVIVGGGRAAEADAAVDEPIGVAFGATRGREAGSRGSGGAGRAGGGCGGWCRGYPCGCFSVNVGVGEMGQMFGVERGE